MNYIIDANNLAGKLGILKEDDFDKILIGIIRDWLGKKQKIVVLIFDSLDPMGDRQSFGYLEVIYSPRDGYYKTADDKIIEIFTQWANYEKSNNKNNYSLNIISRLRKDDLVFVSDDIDLKNKIKSLQYDLSENVKQLSNDEFISILNKDGVYEDTDLEDDRGLSEAELDKINKELMDVWRGSDSDN